MFHQNLSPTNMDRKQRKDSKEQGIDISATVAELSKMENLEDANVASSNEDFSPVREASLRRMTRTPLRHTTSDAVASDLEEVMSFTGKLNRMRSPMPFRHQVRSLDQELQDSTTSFIAEDGTFWEEPAPASGLDRETRATSLMTDDASEVEGGDEGDDELTEDDTQSVFSMASAQVFEARTQTFTRMTPSPLHPRRCSQLSPIAEASHENPPVTDGSTTLVEVADVQHQSPNSSGQDGFSPYAEDSSSSHRPSASPCQRIPFGHLNASLLGSTPARPSPLQQVLTATQASLRALNLEDFELPEGPTSPPAPTQETTTSQDDAHLSDLLHVPLEAITELQTNGVVEAQLLIAMNAYIAHVSGEKRTRFLDRVRSLLAAHNMPPHVAPQFAQMVLHNASSLPENATSGSLIAGSTPDAARVDTLIESNDQLLSMVHSTTPSTTSELVTPTHRPFATLSRNEILDKMARNNEDLRDMIMSWKDHDTTANSPHHARSPSFSPAVDTSPLSVQRRRYSGHTRSSLARTSSPAAQSPAEQSPSHRPASSRMSMEGKRRFSDHTFASANRSLQTVKIETPSSSSKQIAGAVKAATPNIVAPTPPSVPVKSTSRIAVRADKENEKGVALSKIATPSRIVKPDLRNTPVLRPKSPNAKLIPRQPPVKLPPLPETPARFAKSNNSDIPVFSQDDVVRRARQLLKDWTEITEHLPVEPSIDPFEAKLEHEDSSDFAARFENWHDDFLKHTVKVLDEFGAQSDEDSRRDSGNEEDFKDRSVYKRKLDEGFRKLESELNMTIDLSRSLPNLLEGIGSPIDPRVGETF